MLHINNVADFRLIRGEINVSKSLQISFEPKGRYLDLKAFLFEPSAMQIDLFSSKNLIALREASDRLGESGLD